jgi:hypothetical protein
MKNSSVKEAQKWGENSTHPIWYRLDQPSKYDNKTHIYVYPYYRVALLFLLFLDASV